MTVYESRYRRMHKRQAIKWQALHAAILIALSVVLVLAGLAAVRQIDAEDKARFEAAQRFVDARSDR